MEATSAAEYPINFGDGTAVRAVGYHDGVLSIVSERAQPPGRPLSMSIALASGTLVLAGKSMGSKRRPDAAFDVRVRLSSLRRAERHELERTFSPAPPPPEGESR